MLGPLLVTLARALALRLAARTGALAAAGPEDHFDLSSLSARLLHLCSARVREFDFADIISH
jgi:hypothetical protein